MADEEKAEAPTEVENVRMLTEGLDVILSAYGVFHSEMTLAFSYDSGAHVRDALKALDKIYEIMP